MPGLVAVSGMYGYFRDVEKITNDQLEHNTKIIGGVITASQLNWWQNINSFLDRQLLSF